MRIYEKIASLNGFTDKYDNTLNSVRVGLSAAQVKALFTTPIQLIPAPGAKYINQIEKVIAHLDYSGAVFAGANNLEIRQTNGAGTKVTADLTAAFLNTGADITVETSGIVAQTTRLLNAKIVVAVPVANPTGVAATSSLYFIVFYRKVKVAI